MLNHDNTQDRNQKAAPDASSQDSPGAGSSSLPSLSLPKGGGAIRGMGEKFAANPVTGTGSMTVPIATSPGRSGFGPQRALDQQRNRRDPLAFDHTRQRHHAVWAGQQLSHL